MAMARVLDAFGSRHGRCTRRILPALALSAALGCSAQKSSEPAPQVPPAPELQQALAEPAGLGSLEVRTDQGDVTRLRLKSAEVAATQHGDMVELTVTHRFLNDSDAVLEGTFRFPMPDGALLTGLSMIIDGKLVEGELVERERAKQAYEAVVDAMQDPALLEWEHGSVFKMRVFPLEPHKDKIVTLRYFAPLRRGARGLEFVQAAGAPAGGEPLAELRIDFQGRRVVDERNVAPGRVFSIPAQPASAILSEARADGSYSVVRLNPDWSRVAQPEARTLRNWFVVVDTSRSALEEFPREIEGLSVLLASLPAGARFQLVTSDLTARAVSPELEPATPAAIAAALDNVKQVTPDGASDLGRAFELVSELIETRADSAVLYLGDCEPTWGLTKPDELLELARQKLPAAPIFPVLFGSSVDDDLAARLAEQSDGWRARVRRREDLDAFAATLATGVPRLKEIEVQAGKGVEVLPEGALTLEMGRDLELFVKAPAGVNPLAELRVLARTASGPLDLLPHVPAQATSGVARRFGAALVHELEREGKPKADVVQASLDYGVMSKFTSFLVLESEEAYARFSIERKRAEPADAPRVTGSNLENADGAEISADRVQPGDPEIAIDAERDALGVKVEFPFGETKLATYDLDAQGGRGAWMVRFLVPPDTREGRYDALAQIQHRDGSVETRRVSYTVDRTGPELDVRLERSRRHPELVAVWVTQRGSERSDLRRVEIQTPAGTTYELVAVRWGTFRALVPSSELASGTLRVVGFDQALNHSLQELILQ